MKTPEVRARLRARHSSDRGWVTLEEYAQIDMLAFACHGQYGNADAALARGGEDWDGFAQSGRYPWIGYEIKVSRSDFRAELRKPNKRAWGVAITNQFFFAAPAGLIKPHEVPVDCGLVEVTRGGTKVVVRAPVTPARPLPQLHVSQMLRHGIEPGFIRAMEQIKASAKWREKQAEAAMKAAAEEGRQLERLLAERLGHLVTPGSTWKASRFSSRQRWAARELRVVVSDVAHGPLPYGAGEGVTVRYESPEFDWSPRQELGAFLRDFELSGTMPQRVLPPQGAHTGTVELAADCS